MNPGQQPVCYDDASIISLNIFDEHNNPIDVDKQTTRPDASTILYTFTKKIR